LAGCSDYDSNEIFATLPPMTEEQMRELFELLTKRFQAMMAGLEFNSSGLLKAALEASTVKAN
jgi:hypothetical protein